VNRPAVPAVFPGDGGRVDRRKETLVVPTISRPRAGAALGHLPLYTLAPDADAGGVTGRGVRWVVSPGDAAVTGEPPSRPAPGPGY
jgi:hypothetical protein